MILVFSAADYAVSVLRVRHSLSLSIPLPPSRRVSSPFDRQGEDDDSAPASYGHVACRGRRWRRLAKVARAAGGAQPWRPKRVFDALCCRRRLTPATSCGGTCADTTSASSLPPPHHINRLSVDLPRLRPKREARKILDG